MIITAALGMALIVVVAVVVGVVDALRAAAWRTVAAERRLRWEQRQGVGS